MIADKRLRQMKRRTTKCLPERLGFPRLLCCFPLPLSPPQIDAPTRIGTTRNVVTANTGLTSRSAPKYDYRTSDTFQSCAKFTMKSNEKDFHSLGKAFDEWTTTTWYASSPGTLREVKKSPGKTSAPVEFCYETRTATSAGLIGPVDAGGRGGQGQVERKVCM
jgi:hypothetical protein